MGICRPSAYLGNSAAPHFPFLAAPSVLINSVFINGTAVQKRILVIDVFGNSDLRHSAIIHLNRENAETNRRSLKPVHRGNPDYAV